ncbi:MAG: alpha/beta fold hydrolase [Vicinamibacterales bacterium]
MMEHAIRARTAASALLALVAIMTSGEPALLAAGRVVNFRTSDGRMVAGFLNEASQKPAPAVVLVPMLGRSKDDWQAVGQRLVDANITSLAIDLPGQEIPADALTLAAWSEDVRAALNFLEGRPDVRAGSLGVAGASLGASLAAVAAAADVRIHSLALVSPSLDYRGLRIEAAMRQYGSRPALLVASRQDAYAARSVRDLAKDAPGIRETEWSDTAAHGMGLLTREPDLVGILVEWFRRTLG